MTVRDIDHGYRKLVESVYGLRAPKIDVGILAADGAAAYAGGDGATVLEVAMWNEFGAGHVPERSFIRAWFDENEDACGRAVVAMMRAVLAGRYTSKQAVELLAQRFVAEIQRRMAQGIPPPNAPSTVAAKGSDKPLIDTGQLRSSISYLVRM